MAGKHTEQETGVMAEARGDEMVLLRCCRVAGSCTQLAPLGMAVGMLPLAAASTSEPASAHVVLIPSLHSSFRPHSRTRKSREPDFAARMIE